MIGFPTIMSQDAAMRRLWPKFQVEKVAEDRAVWRGVLRPLAKPYEVSINYRAPLVLERLNLFRMQPRVYVDGPRLQERPGDPEGKLPHSYWDAAERPFMCLFSLEAAEWTPADLLAETTVLWAIDWLASYEGWLATGRWTGGGRHPQTARAS